MEKDGKSENCMTSNMMIALQQRKLERGCFICQYKELSVIKNEVFAVVEFHPW